MEGTPISDTKHRLIRHVWLLLTALLLPLVAPRVVLPAAGAADGSVTMSASIERIDVPEVITRPAQTIVVARGQTLATLAAAYHVDGAALRWANDIQDGQQPRPGQTFLIPPSAGALVLVLPGEKPSQFAARLHVDAAVVLDYNQLTSDAPLPGGTYLQIPLSVAPHNALQAAEVVPVAQGVAGVSRDQHSTGNIFPYGQCTWYVASRRNVTWEGNAWQWWDAARGIRPEGHVPVVDAIVVMDTGWDGHVGVVDKVNPDGTFVMSEMNYYGNGGGWGRVDQRTLSPAEPWIMGFIY